MQIASGNEADVVVLVGGVGLGPRDFTCEAVDGLTDRRIEGFGEGFRQLMRDECDAGVLAALARATAGMCQRSLVVALPRKADAVRAAVRALVIPAVTAAFVGGG